MIVYKDYVTFIIMGEELNLISDIFYDKEYTVAEYNNSYYYLGEVSPTIESAIFAWEKLNNQTLTPDKISRITINNHTKKKKEENMATTKTTKKPAAKKPVAKKPAAKKATAKKPAAKKPAAKKASAKKPVAKKPAAKKATTKKPAAKKTAAKKPAAKKPAAKKPSVKKASKPASPVSAVVDSTGVVTVASTAQ